VVHYFSASESTLDTRLQRILSCSIAGIRHSARQMIILTSSHNARLRNPGADAFLTTRRFTSSLTYISITTYCD